MSYRMCVMALLVLTAGCTHVTVSPSNKNTQGYEYFLPKPLIIVTPKADGTIKVKKVLVPDFSRGYRIDAWSALSSHSCSVKIADGLLQAFSLSSDSTEVVSGALSSGGGLATELLALEAERRKAEREAAANTNVTPTDKLPRPRVFEVCSAGGALALTEVGVAGTDTAIRVLPPPRGGGGPDQHILLEVRGIELGGREPVIVPDGSENR